MSLLNVKSYLCRVSLLEQFSQINFVYILTREKVHNLIVKLCQRKSQKKSFDPLFVQLPFHYSSD